MSQLPDTLSALILVALADLEAVEASDRYKVDMAIWHSLDPYGEDAREGKEPVCSVCFAGAVIANTLKAPISKYSSPAHFANIAEKLTSLDSLRSGNIIDALYEFYCCGDPKIEREVTGYIDRLPKEVLKCNVIRYKSNPRAFKAQMSWIASKLEAVGS